MKRVVFWDFDGTLVYCKSLWSASVHQVLLEQLPEVGIVLDDVRPHMATGYPWDLPQSHAELKNEAWWPYLYNKFATVYQHFGMDEEAAARLGPYTRELILDTAKYNLYDDTFETLEQVRLMGLEQYILSNNYPELLQMIRALGLEGYFKGFIISGELGYDKPQKEIFEYALELAGHPEFCIMVGDNPKADVEGARSAGMPSILVHRNVPSRADFTCSTLSEIPAILQSLIQT